MMNATVKCPHCERKVELTLSRPYEGARCPHCQEELLDFVTPAFEQNLTLEQCPVCGTKHLFRQKDFNRKWGIALVALGVLGAYFTYGLSLLVVTLLDFWLYRRVGEVAYCYLCQAAFRKDPEVFKVPPFDLELHDYYRNLIERSGSGSEA